jgi:hypothetical protein
MEIVHEGNDGDSEASVPCSTSENLLYLEFLEGSVANDTDEEMSDAVLVRDLATDNYGILEEMALLEHGVQSDEEGQEPEPRLVHSPISHRAPTVCYDVEDMQIEASDIDCDEDNEEEEPDESTAQENEEEEPEEYIPPIGWEEPGSDDDLDEAYEEESSRGNNDSIQGVWSQQYDHGMDYIFAEQDDPFDLHGEIVFPYPQNCEDNPLVNQVNCSFDVDSIYFMGDRPSEVLRAIGGDGICRFNTSFNRIWSTKTSRIAADYRGNEDLLPRRVGSKLRRLKVISLQNFPNTRLCMVTKGNVPYTLSLFILQPASISPCNYIKHEILLTMVAAYNIAIDGDIPFSRNDVYGRMTNTVEDAQWRGLNYFVLQDGSVEQKKKLHDCHKYISSDCGAMFFYRYERALQLMATNPGLIDSAQQELDEESYWIDRQGKSTGGSGAVVPLVNLRANAALLLENTLVIATAAGTKKSYHIDGKETWVGQDVSNRAGGDNVLIKEEFQSFQERQFQLIKRSLRKSFPGLRETSSLFRSVTLFFDVGLELKAPKGMVLFPVLCLQGLM